MKPIARITRIVHDGGSLIAADLEGRVHRLTLELALICSSEQPHLWGGSAASPVYALATDASAVYTRDKAGGLCKWRRDDLRLEKSIDARTICVPGSLLPDEEPSTTMVRGFGIWNGKGYVSTGYLQLAVISLSDFTVERVVPWAHGDRWFDCFCTERPGVHVASDRDGHVYFGSLDPLEFPDQITVDSGNVHRVRHDKLHDRFWVTLDAGLGPLRHVVHGVAVLAPDGRLLESSLWARNDVECLEFSPDGTRVYVGGFDNCLVIYDNSSPTLTPLLTVEGFSHQIIDCTVDDDGHVYVLTQDGEIVKLDAGGRFLGRLGYQRQCVWDLQVDPDHPGRAFAGLDDGVRSVELTRPAGQGAGRPRLRLGPRIGTGTGFTRRLVLTDQWIYGIGWDRSVFKLTRAGEPVWSRTVDDVVHTISVSPDGRRVLVTTTAGAFELDAEDGQALGRIALTAPTWAGAYFENGDLAIAARNGEVLRLSPAKDLRWRVELAEYTKRAVVGAGALWLTGGGGVKELDPADGSIRTRFDELLDNTAENLVVMDDLVCVVTYGMQLAVFDRASGELLALAEDLPDFPKGLACLRDETGEGYLVVGGRGGYLRLLRVRRRAPDLVEIVRCEDVWIEASGPVEVPEPTTSRLSRFCEAV